MTRSFTYDGATNLALGSPVASFRFEECAYRGQVGTGGFDFEDPGASIDLVGLKDIYANESLSNQMRFFTGRLADRGIGRGPALRTGSAKQWQVSVVDLNTMFDDYLLTDTDCNRPAETDIERVLWLVNDSGTLPGVDDSLVAATDEVDMPARDYRDGSHPRNVLDECAEQSGKNFFLITDEIGTYLFYDLATNTAYEAEGSLSSVRSEISDPDAVLATVFAPSWGISPAMRRDPMRVYSDVEVRWDGGSELVNNPTTEGDFRVRQTSLYDSSVKTALQAAGVAYQFLEAASSEEDTLTAPVVLPDTKLGLFVAGQRVNTNFPHLGGSQVYRITKRTVEAWEGAPDRYLVTLTLQSPVKITRFTGRPPGGDVPGGGPVNPPVPDSTTVCTAFGAFLPNWYWANDVDATAIPYVTAGSSITIGPGSGSPGVDGWDEFGRAALAPGTFDSEVTDFPRGVGDTTMSGHLVVPTGTVGKQIDIIFGIQFNGPGPTPPDMSFSLLFTANGVTAEDLIGTGGSFPVYQNHLKLDYDQAYYFRLKITQAGVRSFKVWQVGDSEPAYNALLGLSVTNINRVLAQVSSNPAGGTPPPGEVVIDELVWCYTGSYPTAYRGATYGPVYVATADGITGEFTIPTSPSGGYIPGSLSVTVDGMWQPVTELDPAAGTFDFGVYIPDEDDVIYASWRVPT